jgi:hypothetical protein
MSEHYILKGREAVPVDMMTWARWFEKGNRVLKRETIGNADVSTVFLGLNHQFGDGPPMIFETMVFGGELDQEQDRCSTYDEAERMHERMVDKVKALTSKPPAK